MADDGFVFTDELVNISNQLWAITAMIGAAFCGAVLIIIGIVAMNPVSRPHLDRVSFRILVCALLANTVFGVVNAIGGKFTGPTWACGFTIFLLQASHQLTLEMSSFLLFSIALNLQLVVVHHINGQKMERFYIFGSIIISLWDPLVQDCWYANDNQKERLAWQIGTQLFWTLLTVAGEVITASTVVIYMVRHQLRNRKYIASTTSSRTRSGSGSVTVVAPNDRVAHANVYRGIIFRIVLYPIASALINLTSVACVIHATKEDGVHNWTGYRVLLVSDFVYGGRAVVYALLAITDPALVRALRAFIRHSRGLNSTSAYETSKLQFNTTQSKNQNLSVHIELSTIHKNDNGVIVDRVDSAPRKYEETPQGYADHYSSTFKAPSEIEEGPSDDSPDLESTANLPGSEGRTRLQEDMMRRQEEILARDLDRQEFQKQI
ncbi:hypothetical protein C8R43DRAFT_1142035 [Mycena crocata]|nr:hypothetical protein C8R43DRAFT_1142035 [Mycena crocata]